MQEEEKEEEEEENVLLCIWKTAKENHTHWQSCHVVAIKSLKHAVIWFLQTDEVVNSIDLVV